MSLVEKIRDVLSAVASDMKTKASLLGAVFSGTVATKSVFQLRDSGNSVLSVWRSAADASSHFIGYNCGNSTQTGYQNTGLGTHVLPNLTTGFGNVGIGRYAGLSITTGSQNVAVGRNTLYSLTTGDENLAIGQGSMASATTSSHNVAIGSNALAAVTTNGQNVAIGAAALGNVTGYQNVAV